ncbi:MAG: hypothetical protein PVH49_09090 [Syntrophobacterales bacterium]|jgi:hypothetical protein
MDKEDLKKLAENPEFIKGIYNYCDRWCERCPFTSRCLNFAMGSEQFDDQEAHDLNNEAFWQSLSETFQMTLELLHEAAEEHGIDLDSPEMEEFSEREKFKDEMAKNHECCRAAKRYSEMVDDWFDAAEEMFPQQEEEFNLGDGPDQPDDGEDAEEASFGEALEVVRWYQYQIYVKLMRAVRGDLDDEPEILDEYPKDSDGSAKVALIGIERSIAAWGELRSHFPLQDNDLLEMLVHLEQLRRKVENAFPDARAFIRPGFDRIDLNS